MNTIYIVNAEDQIEQVNYNEMVWRFVDMTTTPHGVAPRFHVREEIWFKIDNDLFEKRSDAEDSSDNLKQDTGTRPEIKEVSRFEGWTWGHQGSFPKQVKVFDSQKDADEWLFNCAEIDFQNNPNAPQTFKTHAAAEEWVKDNANDQNSSQSQSQSQ